jgi:hypothetical protein
MGGGALTWVKRDDADGLILRTASSNRRMRGVHGPGRTGLAGEGRAR